MIKTILRISKNMIVKSVRFIENGTPKYVCMIEKRDSRGNIITLRQKFTSHLYKSGELYDYYLEYREWKHDRHCILEDILNQYMLFKNIEYLKSINQYIPKEGWKEENDKKSVSN